MRNFETLYFYKNSLYQLANKFFLFSHIVNTFFKVTHCLWSNWCFARKTSDFWFFKPKRNRKKQGFEPPLYDWLKGTLNQWAKDLLLSNNNFFDPSDIEKLILRFEKGEKKLTYKIWTIIMFMAWQNKFCRH